jgi:twitching motility protein PilI
MANKQALRDLQHRLAQRMQAVRDEPAQTANWLAVECQGVGLLLSLKQAAEIFTPVTLKPLPYAKPWLLGVANLRGGLFTVVDLAVFLGLRDVSCHSHSDSNNNSGNTRSEHQPDGGQARLVALHADLNINCALWVDRLLGLRSDDQLSAPAPLPPQSSPRPRFAGPLVRDAEGRSWQQLDLEALSKHQQFLRVVL